ncbi:hypothetical protein ABTO68_19630, partial [Acinetobacter baumannii]
AVGIDVGETVTIAGMDASGRVAGVMLETTSASCWVPLESPMPTIVSMSSSASGKAWWAVGGGAKAAALPPSQGRGPWSSWAGFITTA